MVAITEPGWSSIMNVIIHADCKIILKYHTCTHNLICQVRMKPKLSEQCKSNETITTCITS